MKRARVSTNSRAYFILVIFNQFLKDILRRWRRSLALVYGAGSS
jgi:hypothetical protein